jgi:hypothetical protein
MSHECVYIALLDKAYRERLLCKAYMFIGARRCANSAMVTMWLHHCGGCTNLCPCIDAHTYSDLEASDSLSNGLHLYCLIGQHAINRVIAYSFICNSNLAYTEGTRLDRCDVISTASDFGIVIITLDRLFFVLSCWFAPTNASSAQHERRACSESMSAFVESHISSGVGFGAVWARLLVGF